jgi:hypothetical protein
MLSVIGFAMPFEPRPNNRRDKPAQSAADQNSAEAVQRSGESGT